MNISSLKLMRLHLKRHGHGQGNLKRDTESLLIAVQNNAIRTNHIKAKIDYMQSNSK